MCDFLPIIVPDQCTLSPLLKDSFGITAYPDVVEKTITPEHEFLVLACDGIWDVLTNQEVVDFVRVRIAQRMDPEIVSIVIDRIYWTCSITYF